jgi:hypothetical protein
MRAGTAFALYNAPSVHPCFVQIVYWTCYTVKVRLGPFNEDIMKLYAGKTEVFFSKHESMRHQIRGERKSEEQKLNRLRELLQTKVQAASGGSTVIRAA